MSQRLKGNKQMLMVEYRAAAAAVLLCVGLMILPPLAALALAVGLACQGDDRAECLARFLAPADL